MADPLAHVQTSETLPPTSQAAGSGALPSRGQVRQDLQLFREQAIEARAPLRLPSVIQVRAPYMSVTAALSVAVTLAVVTFCIFGRLTQLVTVEGVLVPERNSLKMVSPKIGVLVKNFVTEGQHVKAGDPLFSVTGEEYGADNAAILAHESELIRARLQAIASNKKIAADTSQALQSSLRQEIAIAHSQQEILANSVEVERRAVALDQSIADRKTNLHNQDIVTVDQAEHAQELLSSDQGRLLSLMDSQQSIVAKLAQYEYQLEDAPLQLSTKLADLDEQAKSAEIELAKNEMQRVVTVVAPVDSVVSSDIAYSGQNVTTEYPLVVLTPENSKLIAQLLVPSQGIGFIHKDSAVAIKYDAFPYQTFGYFKGKITSIGSVALTKNELQTLKVPVQSNQAYFNVLASIDLQNVETYGRQTPLIAGSTFSADIAGETRYIWQWILNPLLSIKGNALSGLGEGT